MEASSNAAKLLARIFMGGSFVIFGAEKFWDVGGTVAYIGSKLPLANIVFWMAILIEIGFGILVIVGYRTRWVALFLAFYCAFTTVVFHFDFSGPRQIDHFLVNLVMSGAFLYLFASGPGAYAIEKQEA